MDKQNETKLKLKQRMQIRIRQTKPLHMILNVFIVFVCFEAYLLCDFIPKGQDRINVDANSNILTASFVGDIMMGRNIQSVGEKKGYDLFFKNVRNEFKKSDLVFANLENPVLKENKTYTENKNSKINLSASYEGLESALNAGVNVLSLANNHMYDYGSNPISEMISYFQNTSIYYSGIGDNLEQACQYTIIEQNNIKIGFYSISDVFLKDDSATSNSAGILSTTFKNYLRVYNLCARKSFIYGLI